MDSKLMNEIDPVVVNKKMTQKEKEETSLFLKNLRTKKEVKSSKRKVARS